MHLPGLDISDNAFQACLLSCGLICLGLIRDVGGTGALLINFSLVSFLVKPSRVTLSLSEAPGKQQVCLFLVCIK